MWMEEIMHHFRYMIVSMYMYIYIYNHVNTGIITYINWLPFGRPVDLQTGSECCQAPWYRELLEAKGHEL